jgi:cytochrome c556
MKLPNGRSRKVVTAVALIAGATGYATVYGQDEGLTVGQIMQAIVAPMTNTIWGAYEIQTDAQWQELQNAALTVIAAGTLLSDTGENAANADWQEYNQQMITAARAAIAAIANKDEEALFNAGNDQLYPPCESCHQRYMAQ